MARKSSKNNLTNGIVMLVIGILTVGFSDVGMALIIIGLYITVTNLKQKNKKPRIYNKDGSEFTIEQAGELAMKARGIARALFLQGDFEEAKGTIEDVYWSLAEILDGIKLYQVMTIELEFYKMLLNDFSGSNNIRIGFKQELGIERHQAIETLVRLHEKKKEKDILESYNNALNANLNPPKPHANGCYVSDPSKPSDFLVAANHKLIEAGLIPADQRLEYLPLYNKSDDNE